MWKRAGWWNYVPHEGRRAVRVALGRHAGAGRAVAAEVVDDTCGGRQLRGVARRLLRRRTVERRGGQDEVRGTTEHLFSLFLADRDRVRRGFNGRRCWRAAGSAAEGDG